MIATHSDPIYSSLATDPDFAELAVMYVEEMPGRMELLREAFDNEKWQDLNRLAHQMKGSAGGYGFDPITPFAARLERVTAVIEDRAAVEWALAQLLEVCALIRAGDGEASSPPRK